MGAFQPPGKDDFEANGVVGDALAVAIGSPEKIDVDNAASWAPSEVGNLGAQAFVRSASGAAPRKPVINSDQSRETSCNHGTATSFSSRCWQETCHSVVPPKRLTCNRAVRCMWPDECVAPERG